MQTQLRYWCCFIGILICTAAQAQFGIGGTFQSFESHYWESVFERREDAALQRSMPGVSGYYWFRLEDVRIEFLPEAGYFRSVGSATSGLEANISAVSGQLHVDVYLLDLINDCDCPTFSKQGTFFQRGVFVEVTGGADLMQLDLDDQAGGGKVLEVSEVVPRAGIGIGLDIGISDLVTITPVAFMHWHAQPEWDGLTAILDIDPDSIHESNGNWYKGVTLRAIFRPDYLRRTRR